MRICRSSISSTSPTPIPRGLSAIDVCETHEQGRRPVYVPDGGLVYDVFSIDGHFAALGQNLSHYETGLHGTGEVSLCGERYTSEDGCSYLQRDVKFPNNKQMKDGR